MVVVAMTFISIENVIKPNIKVGYKYNSDNNKTKKNELHAKKHLKYRYFNNHDF